MAGAGPCVWCACDVVEQLVVLCVGSVSESTPFASLIMCACALCVLQLRLKCTLPLPHHVRGLGQRLHVRKRTAPPPDRGSPHSAAPRLCIPVPETRAEAGAGGRISMRMRATPHGYVCQRGVPWLPRNMLRPAP